MHKRRESVLLLVKATAVAISTLTVTSTLAGQVFRERLPPRSTAAVKTDSSQPFAVVAQSEEPKVYLYLGGYSDYVDSGSWAWGAPLELTYLPSEKWELGFLLDAYDYLDDDSSGKASGIGDLTIKAKRLGLKLPGEGLSAALGVRLRLPTGSNETSGDVTVSSLRGDLYKKLEGGATLSLGSSFNHRFKDGPTSKNSYSGFLSAIKDVGPWNLTGELSGTFRRHDDTLSSFTVVGKKSFGFDTLYVTGQVGLTNASDRAYLEVGYEFGLGH